MARVFCIGNGESRIGYDLEKLRPHGKIYGCNAIYRDFLPDVLTSVDHGIMHEIYHAGIAQKIPCYFRDWTKVPEFMYESMLAGGLDQAEIDIIKSKGEFISENPRNGAKEFVMHGANLQGLVKIVKETGEVFAKNVNHGVLRISWIQEPDYSHSLADVMNNKDEGWACGASSGYVACKNEKPDELYLIGHDLYSQNNKVNNVYKSTKHYVSKENSPTPAVNWLRQWKEMFKLFPSTTFIKVNKFNDGRDAVNSEIDEWKGTSNLKYITQTTLDNILKIEYINNNA